MANPENVLVIGASTNEWRYSFIATRMLRDYGHSVICYGKKKGNCAGIPILNEFPTGETFDTITLYLNPENQKQYYQNIVGLKPKRVIFNPGTENPELEVLLHKEGIESEEACTLVLLRTNQF
ncbi:MAG: CoA-binding protein [Bacteroidetes bacterium]|nr:CoA-binding protein [Bacteroidota bacterium]